MPIRTIVGGVLVIAAAFSFSTEAFAQRGSLGLNQGFRFLGGGQSSGYHWRTPGPCVGYYNPWSHHNTALQIGMVPQGAGNYLHRLESCGEAFQTFNEPSGFGQGGDFIGQPAIEPAPDRIPTSNFFESKSTDESFRYEAQQNGSGDNDNNALKTDTSDRSHSSPGFSNSRTSRTVAGPFPEPDRDWAERF